jgi:hypothetical protein
MTEKQREIWMGVAVLVGTCVIAGFYVSGQVRSIRSGVPAKEAVSPEVATQNFYYLKGQEDGRAGRQLSDRQLRDLSISPAARDAYRSGLDNGRYGAR